LWGSVPDTKTPVLILPKKILVVSNPSYFKERIPLNNRIFGYKVITINTMDLRKCKQPDTRRWKRTCFPSDG